MNSQPVVLTGITGFLGSHLAQDLLGAGYVVHALARSSRTKTAEERAVAALERSGTQRAGSLVSAGQLTIHDADLAHVSGTELARALPAGKRIAAIWHCAACTDLSELLPGETHWGNVDATRTLCELALVLDVPRFHHVSTAYQCGVTATTVLEALDPRRPAAFRTAYEWSKWQSEVVLSEALGPRLTIYRPSIVLGPSDLDRITSWQGFYGLLRHVSRLAAAAARRSDTVRGAVLEIPGHAAAVLDFVFVDWVIRALRALSEDPLAAGGVYHLVARERWELGRLRDRVREILACGPILLSSDEEVLLRWRGDRVIDSLAPYLTGSPTFATDRCDALLARAGVERPLPTEERMRRHLALALGRSSALQPQLTEACA